MTNIVNIIRNFFTYELLVKASILLKEKHAHLEELVDAEIAATLVVLVLKTNYEGKLLAAIQLAQPFIYLKTKKPQAIINDIFHYDLLEAEGLAMQYQMLLEETFNDKLFDIIDIAAAFADTKSMTAHRMLSAITPLSFFYIEQELLKDDKNTLNSYLLNQEENIFNAIPEDFPIIELLEIYENNQHHHLDK